MNPSEITPENLSQISEVVIYHGGCLDGFGAAWTVRKYLMEAGYGNSEILYIPGIYQRPIDLSLVKDKNVTIVDFSYPRQIMESIAEVASKVTWIDHHKTAIEAMVNADCDMDGITTTERSGAYLTWNYFFDEAAMPELIKHIDDRDRWVFALPQTKEINANLFSYPYDFDIWDKLMAMDKDMLYAFALQGEAIERAHAKNVASVMKSCAYQTKLCGHDVMAANAQYMFASELGNQLCKENQNCAFSATYYRSKEGRYVFSLRSVGDFDVSTIAQQFGGGGHKNAAGFEVSSLIELGWWLD